MSKTNIKFCSLFNYPESKPEPKCSKVIQEYKYDPATRKVEKAGKTEFYERIQSHADSCRLDRKIAQFQLGNTLALGVPGGEYGDFSDTPDNLATVLQARDQAKLKFEQLPEQIRRIFNDSYDDFANSLKDGSYTGKLQQYATTELEKLGQIAAAGQATGTAAGTN